MTRLFKIFFIGFVVFVIVGCENLPSVDASIAVAHLSKDDQQGFKSIQQTFEQNNPGYELEYIHNEKIIEAQDVNRIIFIQSGGGTAKLSNLSSSKFSIGDIILLNTGEGMEADSLFSSLIFTVPDNLPTNIPSFIRPDWDLNITDTPGGCATETNAYRRILLTWKDKVGPYIFKSLNAHRVRIMDSFSHYHPEEGGFDEFYLVQMAQPTARIITSTYVDLIEKPLNVTRELASELVQTTSLNVGDLVYLPRGIMHRGIGGVLAQVITVPGFIPGAEIGVDHHLLSINQHLGLEGADQIPFNKEASLSAVVK